VVTLRSRDVTSASGQASGLMRSFEALREQVRAWSGAESAGNGG
jgi:hypothetical protein